MGPMCQVGAQGPCKITYMLIKVCHRRGSSYERRLEKAHGRALHPRFYIDYKWRLSYPHHEPIFAHANPSCENTLCGHNIQMYSGFFKGVGGCYV
jgi:hypothetical protein